MSGRALEYMTELVILQVSCLGIVRALEGAVDKAKLKEYAGIRRFLDSLKFLKDIDYSLPRDTKPLFIKYSRVHALYNFFDERYGKSRDYDAKIEKAQQVLERTFDGSLTERQRAQNIRQAQEFFLGLMEYCQHLVSDPESLIRFVESPPEGIRDLAARLA